MPSFAQVLNKHKLVQRDDQKSKDTMDGSFAAFVSSSPVGV